MRRVVADLWAKIQKNPSYASPILAEGLRAARQLGSKERPVVGDTVLGLIRHRDALRRLDVDPLAAWELLLAPPGGDASIDTMNLAPDADDPVDDYTTALSLPTTLARQWWRRLGQENAWQLASTLCGRAPVVLRLLRPPRDLPAHTLHTPRTAVLERRLNLDLLPDYREGRVIVQDAGSQEIVDRSFPGPGARVLDLCAGAGGKSLALAALGAEVQAWDVRGSALHELQRRAARAGLRVRVGPPDGRYDLVLVDAPCSGSGVLRRHPENRLKLKIPGQAQLRLLEQALGLGDAVVYATCSLDEEENERLVRRLGVPQWEATLWPDPVREGYYLAKM